MGTIAPTRANTGTTSSGAGASTVAPPETQVSVRKSYHPLPEGRYTGLRFAAPHPDLVQKGIEKNLFRTVVLRIDLERVTGKAHR